MNAAQDYDQERNAAADQTHDSRGALGLVTERLVVLQQTIFCRSGGVDDLFDGAHGVGADICLDDPPGSVKSVVLAGSRWYVSAHPA